MGGEDEIGDPDEGAPAGEATVDPFADLLFTLIAAVLPAILILVSALHASAPGPATPSSSPARATVTVEGVPSAPIVAEAVGLRLTGAGDRRVPLDAVPDDPGLREILARLRERGEPLLVIVEPDGLESAFLLEPVAAAHGPARMQQVRAHQACAQARDPALATACAAGRSGGG